MRFVTDPGSLPPSAPRREGPWRWLLLTSAAVAAFASLQPWIQVRFPRLFGEVFGPPAWQSSAGFTCLCTSALLAIMTLSESASRASREAVRPASVLLASLVALAFGLEWWTGPGSLRGATAAWTRSFYVGGAALVMLVAACLARGAARRRGGRTTTPRLRGW